MRVLPVLLIVLALPPIAAAQVRLADETDRAAFRAWFTLLADSQFEHPAAEVTDCAALVRFAFREALRAHTWPGNVRELENAVQRALVMNQGDRITPDDLGLTVPRAGFAMHDDGSLEQRLLAAEVKIVSEALERNAGRRRPTARALGISERTLRHKLKLWRDSGIVTAA